LLTGKSPARLHITNWIGATAATGKVLTEPNWQKSLPSSEITIPEVLSAYGYSSACIGKWHLADDSNNQPSPTGQGFNTAIGIAVGPTAGQPDGYFYPYGDPNLPPGFTGEYLTDRLADEAEAFIANNQPGPFFLYLSNYAVHTPIQCKPDYETYFNNKVVPPGSTHPVGSGGRKYAGMIKSVDDSFGRIAKINRSESSGRVITNLSSSMSIMDSSFTT
jgi:arylsulfatase A